MKQTILLRFAVFALFILPIVNGGLLTETADAQQPKQAPIFQVEPGWMKLPSNMVTGVISAVDLFVYPKTNELIVAYVSEVEPGNRLQKFIFKGLGPVPAS